MWRSEGAEADDHFHWRIQGETPGEMRIHGSVVTLVVKRWVSHQIPPGFNQHIFWRFSKCQDGDVGNLLEKSGLEFLGDLWVIWKMISGCSKTKMESSWGGEVLMSIPLADVKVVCFKTTVFSLCLICFFCSLAFKAKSKLSQLILQKYVFISCKLLFFLTFLLCSPSASSGKWWSAWAEKSLSFLWWKIFTFAEVLLQMDFFPFFG